MYYPIERLFHITNKGGICRNLNKQIFIINGSGGVGKDTFVELVSIELNDRLKRFHTVVNFSSVDRVKEIAREIGWDGRKTEKNRKFLSDLKTLCSSYYDMPFQSMKNKMKEFMKSEDGQVLFLHIREPKEIKRAVDEFMAKSVLVIRDSVTCILSNESDKNVYDYKYDFVIDNNGTIEELREKAKQFINDILIQSKE